MIQFKTIFLALIALLMGHFVGFSQGTILPNGARDIGQAPAQGLHPRLYYADADKPAILARRIGSSYYSNLGSTIINSKVNSAVNDYTAFANTDLTSPDWTVIENAFSANEGRNQTWGTAAYEAWLTDNASLKELMIDVIVNYSRVILYTKDLVDGVYSNSVVSSGFYSTADSMWNGTTFVDPTYSWNWNLDQQWHFGGAGMALAYDFLFNDMTVAERDVVRLAIATSTANRTSYGGGYPKGRAISNHYGYHGELATMLCAIKGEAGYDANSFNRIRQTLLDYWEVGFTPEGQCHEDTYGPNLGLREGIRGLIALARNDTNDNIFVTQKFKGFCDSLVQQIDPRPGGPLTGGASGVDVVNLNSWPNHIYESSLIVAKYMRPNDEAVDYLWRWTVGDNYSNVHKGQATLEWSMFAIDVDSSFTNENTLANANLPLTHFSPRRGKLATRSDWSSDALYFQLDARPDAFGIGHDKVDRGNIYLSALGESWAVNPEWNIWEGSVYQSLVHIDGVAQGWKAPSVKWIHHTDSTNAVIGATDLKYAYDWQWTPPWPTPGSFSFAPWEPENSDPRDLGWPDDPAWLPNKIYNEPGIGYVGSYMKRRPYNVVQKAFRSFVASRGAQPYVLLVDDIQKDFTLRDYRWQMALPTDVQIESNVGLDIVLGRAAQPTGPKLLLRVIQANDASGTTPSLVNALITTNSSVNGSTTNYSHVLNFSVNSLSPDFKVLLLPYTQGDSIPATTYNAGVLTLPLSDGSTEYISFNQDTNGRSIITLDESPAPFTLTPALSVASGVEGEVIAPLTHEFLLVNNLTNALGWIATTDQSWLQLSTTNGNLSAGATQSVVGSISAGINWLQGIYSANIQFVDAALTTTQNVRVVISVRGASVPTERFAGAGDVFDLDNKQITLVPVGSNYVVMTASITNVPHGVSGATRWGSPGDDAFWTQNPLWSSAPLFFGEAISNLYVSSNGHITFDAGSTSWQESTDLHFGQRIVSLLWNDLNPSTGGDIYFEHISGDRSIVTYLAVPVYGNTAVINTAQLEIFDDGSDIIRLSYGRVDTTAPLVGISGGTLPAPDWPDQEMDFSSQPTPPTLTLSSGDTETHEWSSPANPASFDLNLNRAVTYELRAQAVVSGSASAGDWDPSLVTPILFPSSTTNHGFELQAVVDGLAEGPETLALQLLEGPGYVLGSSTSQTITIVDQPYDQWRFDHVLGGTNDAVDSDGNGLPQLLEYALHGAPEGAQMQYWVDVDLPGIRLTQAPPSDVTVYVEWKEQLMQAWNTNTIPASATSFQVPSNADRIYMRLKAAR